MKNTSFYNVLIAVGGFMFVNVPYLFLMEISWVLFYATITLLLSIAAITIGIIGNVKAMKKDN